MTTSTWANGRWAAHIRMPASKRSRWWSTAPFTIRMKRGASIEQDLPVPYNGFVFVVDGSVRIGEDATPIERNQVGWLDRPRGDGVSVVRITAQEAGARLVLYAGQPQGTPIVAQGP